VCNSFYSDSINVCNTENGVDVHPPAHVQRVANEETATVTLQHFADPGIVVSLSEAAVAALHQSVAALDQSAAVSDESVAVLDQSVAVCCGVSKPAAQKQEGSGEGGDMHLVDLGINFIVPFYLKMMFAPPPPVSLIFSEVFLRI